MANGGDGYPNFASRMATLDFMDQVTADYVAVNSPLKPGHPSADRLYAPAAIPPRGHGSVTNSSRPEPLSRSC